MRKASLLFSLYFCQGLPGGLLAVALPVMMREQGAGFGLIGTAAFLNLPWLVKFLWAPLVDRFASRRFGRRKSWIIPAQIGMIAVTLALAFFAPEQNLLAVVVLFFVLNLFAATQDIGVDGLAVDVLAKKDLGKGNAAQVSGFKLGNVMGGGVLLSLMGTIGWRGDFLIMAACIGAVLLLLLFTKEEGMYVPDPAREERAGSLRDLFGTLRHLGFGFWLLLFYAKFGETFGGFLIKPVLRDLDFTREQIGTLDGTIGSIAVIVGAVAAGFIYRRLGLRRTFAAFAVLQGIFLILFGLASRGPLGFETAAALNAAEHFAGGGVGVSVFALAMSVCRRSVGAAQFTLSQCVYMSGAFAAQPLGGLVADEVGVLPVFIAGGLMAISLAPILLVVRPRAEV